MSAKKKQARQQFRDAVLKRDRNCCVICKSTDSIDVHHITDRTLMPGGGYVKENGISLCQDHLKLAEEFHQTGGESCAEGLMPEALYIKVGSNHDKALKASQRLEGHN